MFECGVFLGVVYSGMVFFWYGCFSGKINFHLNKYIMKRLNRERVSLFVARKAAFIIAGLAGVGVSSVAIADGS